MSDKSLYLKKCINGAWVNREYSWLQFDKRVLEQAMDGTNPLLERCKFLSIFISNLDEFCQVRLGSLINENKTTPLEKENKTGMTAKEQILAILEILPSFYKMSNETYHKLKKSLYSNGLSILKSSELTAKQKEVCKKYFVSQILPRTSPIVMDSKHPLFRLDNLQIYLLVELERKGSSMMGIAKINGSAPRLFHIPGGKKIHLITNEELMLAFADTIFQGFSVKNKTLVRVTRNADFSAPSADADDEYNFDFSRLIQTKVEERTSMDVLRLEALEGISETSRAFMMKHAGLKKNYVCTVESYFDYKFMFSVGDYLDYETSSKLKFKPFKPAFPKNLSKSSDLIEEVGKNDIFLSYPYQSMDVLIRLLQQCATDPRVVSIKITIYRLANHSKIIEALLRAAENGKEVVAVMELCARFDEENNLYNAQLLHEAGCTVFYGIEDYKVHSKIISITLDDGCKLSYITHLGTGNYNESTAKMYTDLNIITANDEIGKDGVDFFRNLATLNLETSYKRLLVAPYSLKTGLIAEMDKEIEKGEKGVIRAKFNSLTDKEYIDKFIEASQKGVKVRLVVRGICCLIPGVKGFTDNIRVTSIVGRFLEHSRIYSFGAKGEERVYIASADLMTRNLDKRVEIATPILDDNVKKQVLHLLELVEEDNVKARELNSDGTYSKIENSQRQINSQEECLSEALSE